MINLKKIFQSLNITALLLQLVKPFAQKSPDELSIVSNWCFADKSRFDCFSEQTSLLPNKLSIDEQRETVSEDSNLIFDDKSQIYSTFFWLSHWAMRQGLHPICSQMNYQMQANLRHFERFFLAVFAINLMNHVIQSI